MTDYKALYEAKVEEVKELKVEVEEWKEVAMKKNFHPYTGEIIQPKDIINLQKEVYELQDKLKDIEQATEYTAYHELEIERLKKQIDDYWKVDDEIGGFVSGKFPDIASHLRECFEEKERIRKLYLERNKELQDKVDSMESEVLDAQDSYALQKQTDQVYYHGEPLKCIEDGEPITISDVFPNKFIKENQSLKKSNKQKTKLIHRFREQIKGLDKVMLSASFQSWREVQVATNPQYTIQDEIDFLNGETTNQELIKEVFEDLYPYEYEYDAKNKTYIDPCPDTDEEVYTHGVSVITDEDEDEELFQSYEEALKEYDASKRCCSTGKIVLYSVPEGYDGSCESFKDGWIIKEHKSKSLKDKEYEDSD